mgnify:CR=1 FL=1
MIDIHLGIDDTDSNEGMCTTYLTTLILEELMKKNIIMTDYPNLIRLNPNIPWKTRGNASLCLRFKSDKPKIIFKIAKKNSCREFLFNEKNHCNKSWRQYIRLR